jgi:hypothetical protein
MLFEVVAKASPIGIDGDEFMSRLPDGIAYDSHEELRDYLNGNPLVPHITYEVVPLAGLDDFEGVD